MKKLSINKEGRMTNTCTYTLNKYVISGFCIKKMSYSYKSPNFLSLEVHLIKTFQNFITVFLSVIFYQILIDRNVSSTFNVSCISKSFILKNNHKKD